MRKSNNTPRAGLVLAGAAACALVAGCEQDKIDDVVGDMELSKALAQVLSEWRSADLEVTDVHALEGEAAPRAADLGGACIAATVGEIPVVLCEHDSPEGAKAAEERGLELVGAATGLSLARDALLLVAADRHQADPDGRRLNEIANAFRKLE